MFTSRLFLDILIVILVITHALVEKNNNRLGMFLGSTPWLRFKNRPWLSWMLFALAILVIIVPFTLAEAGIQSDWLHSFVIGGFIGDAILTHWVPSIVLRRWSPGTLTATTYFYLAFMLWITSTVIAVGVFAGIMAFAILWPTLWIFRKVGILEKA